MFGATTFSITTLTIKGSFATLGTNGINDMQQFMLNAVMLNVVTLSVIMLSVNMLSVVMLSVVMLNVVMLSVVAPQLLDIRLDRKIRQAKNTLAYYRQDFSTPLKFYDIGRRQHSGKMPLGLSSFLLIGNFCIKKSFLKKRFEAVDISKQCSLFSDW
jgi:hypothetical protein